MLLIEHKLKFENFFWIFLFPPVSWNLENMNQLVEFHFTSIFKSVVCFQFSNESYWNQCSFFNRISFWWNYYMFFFQEISWILKVIWIFPTMMNCVLKILIPFCLTRKAIEHFTHTKNVECPLLKIASKNHIRFRIHRFSTKKIDSTFNSTNNKI